MTTPFSLLSLLRIEARKLTGRALLWVEMGILALLVVALHAALMVALAQPDLQGLPPEAVEALRASLRWPDGLLASLSFANGGELGGLFVAVLAGALVAQEYTRRTVHFWLSRGVGRGAYLLAKFGVIAAALVLLVLTTLVAGGAITGGYTLHTSGHLPWGTVPWGRVVAGVFKTALTLLPYAAFTTAIAVLSRSTMVAISVGVGYSLLVENLAAEMLMLFSPAVARVARYLPAMLAKSVMQTVSSQGASMSVGTQTGASAALLEPATAGALLVLYTLIGLAVAWWAFRGQDIRA